MKIVSTEILVIGSGIAGLSFALKAAEHGEVALVTKKQRAASNTNYAQGGIAAVMSDDDSIEFHARDTIVVGAGLCHTEAVYELVREGPARVRELIAWGVDFTRGRGGLSLGREGGHSHRRIVHSSDLTGREIERALLAAAGAHERIQLFEDHIAVDLCVCDDPATGGKRCAGATVLDHRRRELIRFDSPFVLLATGGLSQAYLHTTNPDIATGDGVAMAYRAGAEVANLEFVQFHPTALYPSEEGAFLISEAVRGEGAVLRRRSGQLLMDGVHPMGSLAPRDIVARAIDLALKETGDPYVLLDLSPIPRADIEARFPGILAECASRGIDIRTEPIPVVPAAHYACGGVRTDARARTTLPGLYAAGEVACTGVHGANRLASNSLLEAVVYSHRAAEEVPLALARAAAAPRSEPRSDKRLDDLPHAGTDAQITSWRCRRDDLRRLMWEDAGIVRSTARLEHASAKLADLRRGIEEDCAAALDPSLIELRNLAEVASLIVRCALLRRESRGLHYTLDYPYRDNERHLRDTVLAADEA
jgi:L-aspartate oxidase